MQEMLEALKIIHQAVENLPSGAVNIDPEGKAVMPDKSATYRSIEGLIHHFELVMPNRQWDTPVNEVYGANETANGELGFYVVGDGTGRSYRTSTSRSFRT
jgi:NADH-quinone oxidoreductase subunit D